MYRILLVFSIPKWKDNIYLSTQVLVEYRNKDPDHVEWAKALKDLYLPGLRDYVKCYYPLGLSWAPAGAATTVSAPPPSTSASSVSKAPPAKAPAPPPPPPASLFSSETPPSQPKSGMSAVFKEISSGKAVTAGTSIRFLFKKRYILHVYFCEI